nr:hypothetical protein GCM10020093_012810 [Planobispora longispora]
MDASTAWWRESVVYQIYPRSFADSDGDGVGDLAGITARLGHVAGLGAQAVWLTPFQRSPQADHGYDVSDYCDVDPVFGSLADFDAFAAEARRLGLKVIVDLVPNHCSVAHPLFRAALAAGPGSPERARFHFAPGRGPDGGAPPNNWFSVFGGPAWTRVTEPDGSPGEWYLHLYAPSSPTGTGATRAPPPSSTTSCGSGSTGARTGCASTSPTDCSRPRGCPTSGAPGSWSRCGCGPTRWPATSRRCTRSTAAGGPSPTPANRRAR